MTDREVATGQRRGRVRTFVANRSVPQRVGAVGAVLVLATAPFGGLRAAHDETVPLHLGQRIDIGPFYLTIDSVKQVGSLPPVVDPAPAGSRVLVIRTEITNHTDHAELASLVRFTIGGSHIHLVPFDGETSAQPRLFDRNDAVEVPDGEMVNPGMTYQWALVLLQRADDDIQQSELKIFGYHFEEQDTETTLGTPTWVPNDDPLAQGHVPVEVDQ